MDGKNGIKNSYISQLLIMSTVLPKYYGNEIVTQSE